MSTERQDEMLLEKQHLKACRKIIRENIRLYEEKEKRERKEVTQLYQAVKKGEGDSYGLLTAGQNILEHTRNMLRKNRAAMEKAYFGRIDYADKTYGTFECRYIGKNGVTKNSSDVVIVDWRAPVSSVYYENESGPGVYQVPGSSPVEIDLKKKRTFDISGGDLLGFYDDDVAANDDLLVKYLSQNKEAVLGDIIATIQKEQNAIIRDVPNKNMIVQGVAGSGKTTVALHRISYLLYNYEDKYKPSEFCIIGSSDVLLNYISSGLPELDVNHVSQMRMDLFLPYLMGRAWKKKFQIVPDHPDAPVKCRLAFARKLEEFLARWKERWLCLDEIRDPEIGVILSRENMEDTRDRNPGLSLLQLEKLLNQRIQSRIRFLCTEREEGFRKEKQAQYRKYFDSAGQKWTETGIYLEFLRQIKRQGVDVAEATLEGVKNGRLDLYDTAALGLIYQRILMKKEQDEFSQIIVDEAQDFGETVYYVMKQMLPGCYFTIMGDVSQNIRYATGLNDWEDLKKILFDTDRDAFCLLAKSYRNTIEISNCAGKILEKASQGAYKIQPVIRHGKEVENCLAPEEGLAEKLRELLEGIKRKGFETIAVVTKEEEEAAQVRQMLEMEEEGELFHNGVMVLPVRLTKGLEFDAVILWKPDEAHYAAKPQDAKLLYVAVTRALHELYLLGDQKNSSLFE